MRKKYMQFILYILEIVFFVAFILTVIELIENKTFFDWVNNVNSYDFLEKATALFLIYQILTFAILTLRDSSKKDAILTNIKMIKLSIVRFEHNVDLTSTLNEAMQIYKSSDVLIYKKDIEFIEELEKMHNLFIEKKLVSNEYYFYLKNKLVNLEHTYEYYSLEWRLSFLLRLTK